MVLRKRCDDVITDLEANVAGVDDVITDLIVNVAGIDDVITDLVVNVAGVDVVLAILKHHAVRIIWYKQSSNDIVDSQRN